MQIIRKINKNISYWKRNSLLTDFYSHRKLNRLYRQLFELLGQYVINHNFIIQNELFFHKAEAKTEATYLKKNHSFRK